MSDTWINIRIGARHLKLGRRFKYLKFRVNPYHIENPPEKFIEVYGFFGFSA